MSWKEDLRKEDSPPGTEDHDKMLSVERHAQNIEELKRKLEGYSGGVERWFVASLKYHPNEELDEGSELMEKLIAYLKQFESTNPDNPGGF